MAIETLADFIGFNEFSRDKNLWKALIAEFVGTMLLVYVGCGSCLGSWSQGYEATVVQIAFAFGVIVATMVQAIGHVSGGHINPAVTVGMLVARQVSVVRALLYIIVQSIGAITGAAILAGITPPENHATLGGTALQENVTLSQGFGIELIVTFILVLTVFAVCDGNRTDVKGSAPLAIGFAVLACHLSFVPITGSSMNPARSFGPAVITGDFTNHWVYWVGPISGGILAALLYTYVFKAEETSEAQLELINVKMRS